MTEWMRSVCELGAAREPVVVVTVVDARGSSPSETGAKMLVTANSTLGTIGGGRLEYRCTALARELFGPGANARLDRFPLNESVGQFCGGVVDVLFEPMNGGIPDWLRDLTHVRSRGGSAVVCTHLGDPTKKIVVTELGAYRHSGESEDSVVDRARRNLGSHREAQRVDAWFLERVGCTGFNVAVFGAGHVGSAVVRSLCALDCEIRWIDARPGMFGEMPRNLRAVQCGQPAAEVDRMPPGSCYLVMTHDHDLDFDICQRVLERGDAAYCGMIGSRSKRRRFVERYRVNGLEPEVISQLVCPIGIGAIRGKKPAEIAISVSAQVLHAYEEFRRSSLAEPAGDDGSPAAAP